MIKNDRRYIYFYLNFMISPATISRELHVIFSNFCLEMEIHNKQIINMIISVLCCLHFDPYKFLYINELTVAILAVLRG